MIGMAVSPVWLAKSGQNKIQITEYIYLFPVVVVMFSY